MITIEIKQEDLKANKRLIRKIGKLLYEDEYFHFFYEPKLIIRVNRESRNKVTAYLKERGIRYSVYTYPFAKNVAKWEKGTGYGEAKHSVVYRYRNAFLPLMHINATLALKRNKRDDLKIFERETHTMMNAFGYEWVDEAIVYQWLAGGRTSVIRKYGSPTLAASLICLIVMKLSVLNMFLLKALK